MNNNQNNAEFKRSVLRALNTLCLAVGILIGLLVGIVIYLMFL